MRFPAVVQPDTSDVLADKPVVHPRISDVLAERVVLRRHNSHVHDAKCGRQRCRRQSVAPPLPTHAGAEDFAFAMTYPPPP